MTNLLVLLPAAGDYRSRSAGNTCIQWRGQISNAAWGSNLNGRFQMIWWDRDAVAFAALENGLAKMNRVHTDLHDQYQDYAAALSLFAKGYGWIQHPQAEGEASRIRRYFSDAGQAFLDDQFFDSSPVNRLVGLQPLIASEEHIDNARRAKRSMALSDEEWSNARRAHREFVIAAQDFYENRTSSSKQRAARQLGQLLWQIRSIEVSHPK